MAYSYSYFYYYNYYCYYYHKSRFYHQYDGILTISLIAV